MVLATSLYFLIFTPAGFFLFKNFQNILNILNSKLTVYSFVKVDKKDVTRYKQQSNFSIAAVNKEK